MILESNEAAEVLRQQIADGTRNISPDVEIAYPELTPSESIVIDWKKDQHARGSYSFPPLGYITSQRQVAEHSTSRTHYAGEHTSPLAGYMEGALQSGIRAASAITGVPEKIAKK